MVKDRSFCTVALFLNSPVSIQIISRGERKLPSARPGTARVVTRLSLRRAILKWPDHRLACLLVQLIDRGGLYVIGSSPGGTMHGPLRHARRCAFCQRRRSAENRELLFRAHKSSLPSSRTTLIEAPKRTVNDLHTDIKHDRLRPSTCC